MNSRAPRVLHVGKFYAPHRGGIETHLQLLCGELRKYVDLHVIVANGSRSQVEESIEGVPVKRIANWGNVASAPLCPGMVQAIRESDADIVHLHLPNPSAVLAYLASGHRGVLICSYHSDTVRQRFLSKLFQPFLLRALHRSAAVVAASPNYVESSPVLRPLRERCRMIPYGIPIEPFQKVNPDTVAAIREQYGPNLVLAVGRLVYYKGFQYLIEAMKNVTGRLLLIGDGPLRAELHTQARLLGIADRVVFLGQVEDTVPYYHASDLFVLPSVARSEAFGIVQLEAMACGKPVINTELDSGVTFVSKDGQTGITVPPRNAEALASAIKVLLDNADLRARYGAASQMRVRQLFRLETMTEKMLELYADVCVKSARPELVLTLS